MTSSDSSGIRGTSTFLGAAQPVTRQMMIAKAQYWITSFAQLLIDRSDNNACIVSSCN